MTCQRTHRTPWCRELDGRMAALTPRDSCRGDGDIVEVEEGIAWRAGLDAAFVRREDVGGSRLRILDLEDHQCWVAMRRVSLRDYDKRRM